jgi:hypothetical protein
MPLDLLLLTKTAVTVLVVLSLSAVAEKGSPRLAGVLASYPVGSAIALGFYGVEFGADFAGRCASYNLAGLVASQFFVFLYFFVSRRPCRFPVAVASLAAFAGFIAAAWLMARLQLQGWGAVVAASAAIIGFSHALRGHEDVAPLPPVRYSVSVLLQRSLLAAAMVVAVTGVAGWVGPRWAGLLSAFPVTLYPLLLVMHRSYGPAQARAVIRHFPAGLWSVVAYSLTVAYAYPVIGLLHGTLLGFAAATAVLAMRFLRPGFLPRRQAAASNPR